MTDPVCYATWDIWWRHTLVRSVGIVSFHKDRYHLQMKSKCAVRLRQNSSGHGCSLACRRADRWPDLIDLPSLVWWKAGATPVSAANRDRVVWSHRKNSTIESSPQRRGFSEICKAVTCVTVSPRHWPRARSVPARRPLRPGAVEAISER